MLRRATRARGEPLLPAARWGRRRDRHDRLATLDADPATCSTCSPSRSRSGRSVGRSAPAYGGAPVLRPEHFTLSRPAPPAGLALLGAAFVGIGAAGHARRVHRLVVLGARLGTVPVLLAIPGTALQLALVVVLSRLAARGVRRAVALARRRRRQRADHRRDAGCRVVGLDRVRGARRRARLRVLARLQHALQLLPSSWGRRGRAPLAASAARPRRAGGAARAGLDARARPAAAGPAVVRGSRTRPRRLGVPQGAAELVA